MKETGYVLKTTINGKDMFYGVCEVEGDIVEPGLIGSYMTTDLSEINSLSKSTEAYRPSTDTNHQNITWKVEKVEVKI